ncbi:MAG TPA: hypothetical protein VE442_10530 [Jatrophihabitans sp.]|nr:hypothetical protein [Jatrophihabitans sp.]
MSKHKSTPSFRLFRARRALIAVGTVIGTAAALTFLAVSASAVHDTGAFELDGNAVNGAAPGDDWDNVCHQVLGSDCSTTSNATGATAVDWVSEPNLNATIFTGGGSKDPQELSNWQWKDGAGGLPDKDNLLHSFAARYNTTKGDVLFFGSDRYDNSGDAQQGFWFFQNQIGLQGSTSGTFNGLHKAGDLLVVSDFSNGGTTSTITVYAWDPTCTKTTGSTAGTCGDANLRIKGTSNAASCASAAANDNFCGIVNPSTITMPWSFTDKSGTPTNQALNGEFYEGGVNLSAIGLGDKCFASVASETRSSTSTTATLKDFVLGNFGACDTTVHTTPSAASVSIGTGSVQVTDTATVTVSGTANWSGSLAFSLCGPLASADGCASGGTAVGSLGIDNTTSQPITSPAAAVTSVGTYCWRADFTPSATSAANGVKPGSDGSTTECFTVTPVTPTLATSAGAGPVQLGNPISDTATLSGTANEPGSPIINPTTAGGPAGGMITFTAYGPNNCSTVAFTSSAVQVSGDGTYGPVSFTPTAPGTYHWAATYTGDAPNTLGISHNSNCTDTGEDVTVTDRTSASSQQTWLPNDTGTVSSVGGAALNGTLSIQLYTGDNCGATSGSAVSGQLYTRTLTNASSPQSLTTSNTAFSVTASRSVSWKVAFSSTDANVTGSSHCETTSLTITN